MKFKLAVLVAALGFVIVASDALVAQRGRGRSRFGGEAMGQVFREIGNLQLLRQKSVSDDMDLSEEQLENLKQLGDDVRSEIRELFRSMTEKSQEEQMDEVKAFVGDLKGEVDKILLPHQRKRYKQISLQNSMRSRFGRTGGVVALLQNKALLEDLGIDDDEAKELMDKVKKKTEEVNKEVNRKIANIRKEGQKEVMSVLPKKLQKAIQEQLGDNFDFDAMQREQRQQWQRGREGRDGGRRGRGGDGGGGRGGDGGGRGDGDR